MKSKSKKMEGQLMKLKERFIEKEDPSIFLREYLNDTKKILGEVEQAYRTGASDRNKIVSECQKKISEIVELSEETLDLLMKHQSGLLPPEDANQTVNEEPVNEAQGQFTRDMRLWGKGGYTYLSGELDQNKGKVHLPKGELTMEDLLEDFSIYCRGELKIEIDDRTATWGGRCFSSSGLCHHVLIRPRPVLLRAHPEAFMLLLCDLAAASIDAIIERFVERPGFRRRLALVDLEKGYKINLTRSDVFVHFERYLRRVHGLRLVVHPDLTQGLVDGGIMKLEMG